MAYLEMLPQRTACYCCDCNWTTASSGCASVGSVGLSIHNHLLQLDQSLQKKKRCTHNGLRFRPLRTLCNRALFAWSTRETSWLERVELHFLSHGKSKNQAPPKAHIGAPASIERFPWRQRYHTLRELELVVRERFDRSWTYHGNQLPAQ